MPDIGEFIPEIICLGVDVLICGVIYKVYTSTTNIIKDLSDVPEISIDENLEGTLKHHPKKVEDAISETVCLPYAVIRGNVTPLGKTVTSSYSAEPLHGVIQKVKFIGHKKNMSRAGFWVDSTKILHAYTNDAPFCLTNPRDQSFSFTKPNIEITDWQDAAQIDLDTVYDNFEANTQSLAGHLWDWAMGDIQRGVQKTEMMLTSGTSLTGIGQLESGPMGVKLKPPVNGKPYFLVRSSLSSLIKEYESGRTAIKIFLGIFGGLGVFISGWMAWKYYKKVKSEHEQNRLRNTLRNIQTERAATAETPNIENLPDNRVCVVCLGAERQVILLPCGHVCVCATCADTLISAGHACPVCRSVITNVMPAYVS